MNKPEKCPLVEALDRQIKLNAIPFHMPGHKKGRGINRDFYELFSRDPFSFDLTEIPGLDDLHNPQGPIEQAQNRAARLFGANQTFFLVNGTTVGIHSSVLTVCKNFGDEILLPREVHRSVIGACILSGARPNYLPVRIDSDFLIPYPPKTEEVITALQKKRYKAIIQVYPSYCGLTGDLKEIIKESHAADIPLIIDEAHGAHFGFNEKLPDSALGLGADISIQSTHKTLGAFTQSSMLHVKSNLVDYRDVARQLSILQTTSPSYLLMASLDAATAHMEQSGREMLERIIMVANEARKEINQIPGIKCLGEEMVGKEGVFAIDPTKLYISFRGLGLLGNQAAHLLLNNYKIQVEFSDRYSVLCMLSLGNTIAEVNDLILALTDLAARYRLENVGSFKGFINLPSPQVTLTPREAWFGQKKVVALEETAGEIAAELIAPYPPGIPLVCPGETITSEIIEIINELRAQSTYFHGPADQSVRYLTVIDS